MITNEDDFIEKGGCRGFFLALAVGLGLWVVIGLIVWGAYHR